ncbi:hypothetical protein HBA55_16480 [Pseudomaricurvus alkylphenolicus]|uniref:hypothetical protein n=1 Tax=Pseudomaricurvus alkylphenolicus TaxID=1306991 RepID=UPI001423A560|nr:hypothetical protein [Pseudomaricurvus alkylphenolicus]
MKITLVKKIMADGSPCKKCGDVLQKLEQNNQMQYIDEVLVADERDSNSDGMLLAAEHNVNRAPFFVVEEEGQPVKIHTVYFKFAKEVLAQKTSEKEELKEIMNDNPDLDFI